MLNQETLDGYDVVLMPNFVLPYMESAMVDLIVNIRCLAKISWETIAEYMKQIDRISRLFFYHENIFKARLDGEHGIPSSQFPELRNFKIVATRESRWPTYNTSSAYPCQENLYVHSNARMSDLMRAKHKIYNSS